MSHIGRPLEAVWLAFFNPGGLHARDYSPRRLGHQKQFQKIISSSGLNFWEQSSTTLGGIGTEVRPVMHRTYATLVRFDMPYLDLELFICHFRTLVKRTKKPNGPTENQSVIIMVWAGRCKNHIVYRKGDKRKRKREKEKKRKALCL